MFQSAFNRPPPQIQLPQRAHRGNRCCEKCRQHHTRCDGGEPSCSRCRVRGLLCRGYDTSRKKRRKARFRIVEYDQKKTKRPREERFRIAEKLVPDHCPKPTRRPDSSLHEMRKFWIGPKQTPPADPPENDLVSDATHSTTSNSLACESKSGRSRLVSLSQVQATPTSPSEVESQSLLQYVRTFSKTERSFLEHILHKCYISEVAPIMGISDDISSNPFAVQMRIYAVQSPALSHVLLSAASVYLNFRDHSPDARDCAWHYRATAMSLLRTELKIRTFEVSTLAAIVMLAMTESWFTPSKSGIDHIKAGVRLLAMCRETGLHVPLFIRNALCWMVSLVGYVSDCDSLTFEDPEIYSSTLGNLYEITFVDSILELESPQQAGAIAIDPLVGTWSSLMPYIGMVGGIVRTLRKSGISDHLLLLVEAAETKLMEWEIESNLMLPPSVDAISQDTSQYGFDNYEGYGRTSTFTTGSSISYLDLMAGAYCRAALLTLYTAFPVLLDTRLSLLPDSHAFDSQQYLNDRAAAVVDMLQLIPQDDTLWHVSSLPILAAGSSLASTDIQRRQHLVDNLAAIKAKNKIGVVDSLKDALELVWLHADIDNVSITWLDAFDRLNIEMLIN